MVGLDATGVPQVANVSTDSSMPMIIGPPSGKTADNSVEIRAGENAPPIPPVMLPPLPQCSDGVDNDLDGRVDLDDPDCNNDAGPYPMGATECGATDGPSCNDNLPGVTPP